MNSGPVGKGGQSTESKSIVLLDLLRSGTTLVSGMSTLVSGMSNQKAGRSMAIQMGWAGILSIHPVPGIGRNGCLDWSLVLGFDVLIHDMR